MIQSITISDCVGPYSQCVLKGDILQCIDHAKRLGYEGVEMHMRNAKLNDYHRIKEYADRLGYESDRNRNRNGLLCRRSLPDKYG